MRVSVVIPAYNAEVSLGRAVASVLAQDIANTEIIVVDDGSSDGTAALAARLAHADPRVRLIRNETNKGVSAARNRGFEAARGRWIAVLDGDDAFAPGRLAHLLNVADLYEADMVADNLMLYDWVAEKTVGPAIIRGSGVRSIDFEEFLRNCITGRSPFDYGQLKFMFRRDYVETHRLRYLEELRHGEDFMLYAHALLAGGKFVLSDEPLYLYTQRVGSISRSASQMSRTLGHLDEMRAHTLALLAHPRIVSEPVLAALLSKRARAIRWFQSWERVYGSLRRHDAKSLLHALLSDWRVVPLLVREAARRAATSLPVLSKPSSLK